MKPVSCVFAVILLVELIGTTMMMSSAEVGAPQLFCPQPVYNFGEVDAGQMPSCRFELINMGQAPLVIRKVKSGCGCTVTQVATKEVPPGGATYLDASINLYGRSGAQRVIIAVNSNDPKTPEYTLALAGTVKPAISVVPRIVNFGEILDDGEHSMNVLLRAELPDVMFKIKSVQVAESPFQVWYRETKPGKEYELTIHLPGPLTIGTHYSVINVLTDHRLYPQLQINTQAHCIGDLRIDPPSIKVPHHPDSDITTNQFLRLAGGRIQNFTLLDVIVPVPTMHTEITDRGKNEYYIKLLDMPTNGSLVGKSLLLKINSKDKSEVFVPFEIFQGNAEMP